MSKPRIVQHSFGSPGSGGPIGALGRVLASDMAQRFEFLHVSQPHPAGGINFALVNQMAREMKAFGADIAHVRGLGNEGFHGVLAAKVAGVPKILVSVHGSVRDLQYQPSKLRGFVVGQLLEPLTLRLATHVVTVCEAARSKPVLRAVSKKVIGVTPNGVDTIAVQEREVQSVRSELSIDPEDVVLIMVARLVVDKGGIDLLKALAMLSPASVSRKTHLLLVGDGPDRDLLAVQATLVGNVQVHFLGRRHDVSALLKTSDIALLPSWHENMSNALLEAMAAGIPVIATSVGGNVEVLSKGGGVLVPPHDPQALAAALDNLILDKSRRLELGREAREVIDRAYTTQHMTERLGQIYLSMLGDIKR